MKKNVNLLLIGFIIFIGGLIVLGFELVNYRYVNELPSYFDKYSDSFTLSIENNKTYEILKGKYDNNIEIKKVINNNIKDEVYIELKNYETAISKTLITTDNDKTKVILNSEIELKNDSFEKIYNMVIEMIKNKKLYNYNLLKYNKVYIYGSEENLSKIEIKDLNEE